ncbi:MAG TPA: aminotransferase class IV [Limnochordia bacterium]|nr:aminotransferase class IV [Limnochordia bacterium]
MSETVYLNGRFVPYEEAVIPVEDRGNLFADGIYEVVFYLDGHPFELKRHLDRLAESAAGISLPLPLSGDALAATMQEVVARNALDGPGCEATVYVQFSRGPARRSHAFPKTPEPTCFIIARRLAAHGAERVEGGVDAILLPDQRWHLCNIKSIALLPNILAKQKATQRGVYEGVFQRDGVITEGTSTNFFAVKDGVLRTHPTGCEILSGVTRAVVLDCARELGVACREEALRVDELPHCSEAFLTGSTTHVMPLVRIDDQTIGDGAPGPITRRLFAAFLERLERTRRGR